MRIKIINDILPFLYGIQILYLQDIPIQTSHISTAQQHTLQVALIWEARLQSLPSSAAGSVGEHHPLLHAQKGPSLCHKLALRRSPCPVASEPLL